MKGKAISRKDLQAMERGRRSSYANQSDRNIDEVVNEQHDRHRENIVSTTRGQRITANPSYPQRSIDKVVNEQQVGPLVMSEGQNTDDEVCEQHVDPQAMTRGRKSTRIENNNQRREQSIFDADQHVGGNTNESANEQHDDTHDDVFEQPKTRGYTYVPHLWARNSTLSNNRRLKIEFNQYGKPIGPNKSDFVELLGSTIRNGNVAPLNCKDWHKGIFDVPIGYDKIVLQALGRLWRAFKCRVQKLYFNPKSTMEQNLRRRPDTRDERVKEDQWKFLVEYCSNEAAKQASEKTKENRAMKKMQHITGKRSFAQVYEMENATKEALNNDGLGDDDIDGDEIVESEIELTRADVFSKCYSRDGNTSNPEVANALEKNAAVQEPTATLCTRHRPK